MKGIWLYDMHQSFRIVTVLSFQMALLVKESQGCIPGYLPSPQNNRITSRFFSTLRQQLAISMYLCKCFSKQNHPLFKCLSISPYLFFSSKISPLIKKNTPNKHFQCHLLVFAASKYNKFFPFLRSKLKDINSFTSEELKLMLLIGIR